MSNIQLLIILISISCAYVQSQIPNYDIADAPKLYSKFLKDNGKHYATVAELLQRYDYYKINLQNVIEKNNNRQSESDAWFDLYGDTGDLSQAEIAAKHSGFGPVPKLYYDRIDEPQ